MRTARANGVPHGTIRFGRKPSKWRMKDSILAQALTVYEDGLCRGCGQPRDRAWNEDMEGWYKPHRVMCLGCQAAHLEVDAHGPMKPAETIFVTDERVDDPDPRMMPEV